jgi:hypothetical protein
MKTILTGFLLFACTVTALAQRFGGTPPSVKWKQVDTDTVRIIYAAGLDSQAQRIASIVHYQAAQKPVELGDQLKKVNIVLQNQTTIANGYVGLGPFRSEFYLTPSFGNFELGSLPWADQLAIHEYRHVQQFNNFRNGLSKVMLALFGEEGYALAINTAIPDWFYEGDAVYSETVLSKQGRGRTPLFLNDYPSLWQANKKYSWMKLRNGSFKDYVPDHYSLGYLLVNYGYEKYGADFWKNVTTDASAFKGLLYPFQKAIEKHSGLKYPAFRKAAFEQYKKLSTDMRHKSATQGTMPKVTEAGPAALQPLNKRVLTNYLFPYSAGEDSLLYMKVANNKRPAFVMKDNAGEHTIAIRDISLDQQYSYRNGKVVYTAYENDARWRWRDYSVIKLLDVKTGKQQTITHRSKYFTPDIAPSGTKIAAVQVALNGKSELHVLDAGSGKVTHRISAAEVNLYTDPKFINEDSIVTAVRLQDGKMALAIVDIRNGSTVRLTPPSYNLAGFPAVSNGVIYFTASYGGQDNIYAVKPGEGTIYQLTNWSLGNYFVNVANGKMTWASFTADGYQLQQTAAKDLQWTAMSAIETAELKTMYPVANTSAITAAIPNNIPARAFGTKDYRKGTRLLNFHSWRPYYEDPEFTFSLYGENVLNTMQTEVFYLYNQNDQTHAVGVSATYAKWFPYLSVGSQYTFGRQVLASNNRLKQWNQLDNRIGLSIPLSWVKGKSSRQFNAGSNYFYRTDFNKGFYKDTFTTVRFSYLQYFINMSQQVEMARQHINPRLGYSLSAEYRDVLKKYESWQFLGGATVFLPGFAPTHSLALSGGWQESDTVASIFSNRIAYARGYNAAYFSRMWRLSANYHFPILYPDWGFGNILYLQRVRGNAFYDFMRVYSTNKLATADQRSVGGEIYFDTKWWNQYELSFGFRVSRLLDQDFYSGKKGVNVFEFVLPVSIIPR